MSIGARCGLLVLLAGFATASIAQEGPSGAWKDPPARSGAVESGANGAAPERAAASGSGARSRASRSASAERASARRAERRQARREAARRQRSARAERASRSRQVEAIRRRLASRVRVAAARGRPHSEVRAMTYAHPLVRFRNEGWGPLLEPSRTQRIADARARGFLVLRARTFVAHDGSHVRALVPYHAPYAVPDDLAD